MNRIVRILLGQLIEASNYVRYHRHRRRRRGSSERMDRRRPLFLEPR